MSPRSPEPDCTEILDAAPYVLGALEDAESYREHLLSCASCREEVAALSLVVEALPVSVTPATAPAALRGRILATVRSEAELLHAAGPRADEAPRATGRWRSPRLSFPAAGLAIAASALLAAVIAIAMSGSSTGVRVTAAHLSAAVRGAQASLRQTAGHAELVVSGMRQPPTGKIYEVWLKRGAGAPQPTDALFGVTSRGSGSASVPGSLHGVGEVLVTSEPRGGSLHPTSRPVIVVTLAA
jgi:Anti-sigma-K factor rskA